MRYAHPEDVGGHRRQLGSVAADTDRSVTHRVTAGGLLSMVDADTAATALLEGYNDLKVEERYRVVYALGNTRMYTSGTVAKPALERIAKSDPDGDIRRWIRQHLDRR